MSSRDIEIILDIKVKETKGYEWLACEQNNLNKLKIQRLYDN